MLSILVNNGSFLGHLTLRSIAKNVSDGGESNQTAMAPWNVTRDRVMGSILIPTDIMHHDYLCN